MFRVASSLFVLILGAGQVHAQGVPWCTADGSRSVTAEYGMKLAAMHFGGLPKPGATKQEMKAVMDNYELTYVHPSCDVNGNPLPLGDLNPQVHLITPP